MQIDTLVQKVLLICRDHGSWAFPIIRGGSRRPHVPSRRLEGTVPIRPKLENAVTELSATLSFARCSAPVFNFASVANWPPLK